MTGYQSLYFYLAFSYAIGLINIIYRKFTNKETLSVEKVLRSGYEKKVQKYINKKHIQVERFGDREAVASFDIQGETLIGAKPIIEKLGRKKVLAYILPAIVFIIGQPFWPIDFYLWVRKKS